MSGLTALWAGGVPSELDPSGPQAREWFAQELAKDDYADGRSLFQRIMAWIADQLARLMSTQGTPGEGYAVSPVLTALVVALLLGFLGLALTRIRANRHTLEQAGAVLGDLDLTPVQFRDRGAAALRDGRWDDAVLDYTRAIAREAADRTLLTEAPSLTAHEVGTQLTPAFPAHAGWIASAMDLFDAVRYGRYAALETDARSVAELDGVLVKTRPVLVDEVAVEAGSSMAAP